ncbi:hypothetical protein TrST_g4043 [Triparma strigata]|uniref:AB hydrolase-1 domain-containing protein n=1 Tax=Triparma strigata TaxID=1606541 RepID=A0A9W7BMI8_9STRA|nr:hypothetical protein TrST_g4043 [Triparma strigata]
MSQTLLPLLFASLFVAEGLETHTVPSLLDSHPITVYSLSSNSPPSDSQSPLLLLHGRTWSSLSVYHLNPNTPTDLITSLPSTCAPYMMDFRGFGLTPSDSSDTVSPSKCVEDCKTVLKWIAERHGANPNTAEAANYRDQRLPSLIGWSQGALIAQMVSQSNCEYLNKLVLFGSIYNRTLTYPTSSTPLHPPNTLNTKSSSLEDFTIEGSVLPSTASAFSVAALTVDPIKSRWTNLHEFNTLPPSPLSTYRITDTTPVLLITGSHDPYSSPQTQIELFQDLGDRGGGDKSLVVIAGSDHASHLLEGSRERWKKAVNGFLEFGESCSLNSGDTYTI